MSEWIKVKVAYIDHPKVDGLTDAAFRWMHRAWAYAGKHETDGYLPPAWIKKVPPRVQRELEDAGLWLRAIHEGGREIHDWLEHQQSKQQLSQQRTAAASRQKSRRDSRSDFERINGVTHGSSHARSHVGKS